MQHSPPSTGAMPSPAPEPVNEFLLGPEVTFLNHGSFGATPRSVLAARTAWTERMERQPVAFYWDELPALLREAAGAVAAFVGAQAEDLVFVDNATTAVNAVLRGQHWRPGDRIILLSHAYNAVRQAVQYLIDREGVEAVEIDLPFPLNDPTEVLEALVQALQRGAQLAVLDHVTSPSALVLPIAEMVAACRAAGVPVLIDGAHAPGQLPLDIESLGCDWYAGNLHKWAFAAKGTGFLWVHPDRHDETPPLVVSHGYRGGLAAAFDWPGTRDFGAWLAAPTALDLHRGWGGTRLCARNAKLCAAATSYLSDRFGMANTAPSAMQAAMATLPLPGALPPEAAKVRAFSRGLWQRYRIEVPVLAFAGRAWLRISAQIYNRLTDYERLGDAIARSLADGTLPSAGAVR